MKTPQIPCADRSTDPDSWLATVPVVPRGPWATDALMRKTCVHSRASCWATGARVPRGTGPSPTTQWANPGINHLNYYVQSRLLWDTELDLDALLDDYHARFYGPAAETMQAAFEYGERIQVILDELEPLDALRAELQAQRDAGNPREQAPVAVARRIDADAEPLPHTFRPLVAYRHRESAVPLPTTFTIGWTRSPAGRIPTATFRTADL